jgi:hypothetical protein
MPKLPTSPLNVSIKGKKAAKAPTSPIPQRRERVEPQGITKNELKELMKEAVVSVLKERNDLLEDAVSEAILDMKLGLAVEEGDTGEHVPESEIMSKLID